MNYYRYNKASHPILRRPKENEDIVENFLKNHEKFTIKKLENFMPDENNDGFFIAKLKKVE